MKQKKQKLTKIKPWPKGALAAAYKQTQHEGWDAIELAVAKASARAPRFDD
jgi:hypothetical protein